MKRRTFLQASAAAGASMFMPQSRTGRARGADKKDDRPNILYIFTDQQSSSMMSCAGNEYVKTPAMDSLARAGTRFDRAYCTNPVCVPSRMSMVTGHFPSEMNVKSNNAKQSEVPAEFVRDAMGHLMTQAGYDVGYAGKVHLPDPLKLDKIGFDNYLTKDQRDECAAESARFIKARRDKPFFLVTSLINPHDICYMAIRDKVVSSFDKALIRNGQLPISRLDEALERPEGVSDEEFWNELCPPLPPNYEPLDDEPEAIAKLLSRRAFRVNARENWSEEMWRLHRWAYARLTERVDAQIGLVLQALRESGQEENTVVIFSSDHGDNDASRKTEHKTLPYDEAAGIPFIVSQKGTTRVGVDRRHLVSNGLDLIPTLCDYAGIEKPSHMQGRSVRALAEGRKDDGWRSDLVVQCEIGRAVMMGSYKYIRFDEGANDEQLFDLSSDPYEMDNRIDDPALGDVRARLRRALSRQIHGIDDRFGQAYVPKV
jgi:choline-sulfatase